MYANDNIYIDLSEGLENVNVICWVTNAVSWGRLEGQHGKYLYSAGLIDRYPHPIHGVTPEFRTMPNLFNMPIMIRMSVEDTNG